MNHSNPTGLGSATDKDARALLIRHNCPTPFHVVRSFFMGDIATPRLGVSPMNALAQLWGGEIPVFNSQQDVEEVLRVLVQGLWNRLTDHQNSRNPFRLTRFEVLPTRQALHDLALLRAQELEGFVDGFFGPEDELMLPDKAHKAQAGDLVVMDFVGTIDGEEFDGGKAEGASIEIGSGSSSFSCADYGTKIILLNSLCRTKIYLHK